MKDKGGTRGKSKYSRPFESFGYAVRCFLHWHVGRFRLGVVRLLKYLFFGYPADDTSKGSVTSTSEVEKYPLVATAINRLRSPADSMLPDICAMS